MLRKMRYRLALDLGTTSIGWAMFRLNADGDPIAIIRSGVRIFGDGRNPQDGSSLAVTRRAARAMRRNRDRKLKRKAQLMRALIELGFFPQSETARMSLIASIPTRCVPKVSITNLRQPNLRARCFT
jgi:CRISPR-associated endonuclease Csn1